VQRLEDSDLVEVDAYVRPTHDVSLGDVVLAWTVERARVLAGAAGHADMRIDLGAPVEVPAPGRVTVRQATDSDEDRRLAHRIGDESFADHYGHVDVSFESFQRRLTEQGEGWSSVLLAELDGEPVGVLVATRQFEQDDDAGYVRTLGVLSPGRGHGVAKALLSTYFDQCQRAGRAAVLLHVDVANVTGALRLYESVGMRTVLEIDAWATRVPVVDADTPT
jgi:ribosomal protein S18 acetylase RimI-like enzyme